MSLQQKTAELVALQKKQTDLKVKYERDAKAIDVAIKTTATEIAKAATSVASSAAAVKPKPAFTVSHVCYETYPCQHDVTFEDGHTECLGSGDIMLLYTKAGLKVPNHFLE